MYELESLRFVINEGFLLSANLETDEALKLINWTSDMVHKTLKLETLKFNKEPKQFAFILLILLSGEISRLVAEKLQGEGFWDVDAKINKISKIMEYTPLIMDRPERYWIPRLMNGSQKEKMDFILSKITFKN
jgi:hypothetical protein